MKKNKKIRKTTFIEKQQVIQMKLQHLKIVKASQKSKLKRNNFRKRISNLKNQKQKHNHKDLHNDGKCIPTIQIEEQILSTREIFHQKCCELEQKYSEYGAVKLKLKFKLYQDSRHLSQICNKLICKGLSSSCHKKCQSIKGAYIKQIQYKNLKIELHQKSKTISQFWKSIQQKKSIHLGSISLNNLQKFQQCVSPIAGICSELFPQKFCNYQYQIVVGQQLSTFGVHIDPYSLSGINYLAKGGKKYWYIIPKKKIQKVSLTLNQITSSTKQCSWHLTTLLDPNFFQQQMYIAEQEQGQLLLIFAGTLHQGINLGANMAFLSTYSTQNWLKQINYSQCNCQYTLSREMLKIMQEKSNQYNKQQEINLAQDETNQVEVFLRQQQKEKIFQFLKTIALSDTSSRLLISGQTGVGKTLCTTQTIKKFQQIHNNFKFLYINIFNINNVQIVYKKISQSLQLKIEKPRKQYKLLLDRYFGSNQNSRKLVLIVDQFDCLLKETSLLYNLFQWSWRSSNFSLILISNIIKISQSLPKNVRSRLGYQQLIFYPYTFQQLGFIASKKFTNLKIKTDALQLACKKIYTSTSDFRQLEKILLESVRSINYDCSIDQQTVRQSAQTIKNQSYISQLIKKLPTFYKKALAIVSKVQKIQQPTVEMYENLFFIYYNTKMKMNQIIDIFRELKEMGLVYFQGKARNENVSLAYQFDYENLI